MQDDKHPPTHNDVFLELMEKVESILKNKQIRDWISDELKNHRQNTRE